MICSCGEEMHVSGFIKKQEAWVEGFEKTDFIPVEQAIQEVNYTIWRCKCGQEKEVKE